MKFLAFKTDAHVFPVIDILIDSGLDQIRMHRQQHFFNYSYLVVFRLYFQKIFLR